FVLEEIASGTRGLFGSPDLSVGRVQSQPAPETVATNGGGVSIARDRARPGRSGPGTGRTRWWAQSPEITAWVRLSGPYGREKSTSGPRSRPKGPDQRAWAIAMA